MYRTIIIDDEPPARHRILRLCKDYSEDIHIITEANCGVEAVKLIDKLQPDLIFLDIQLPDISGLDVLKEIKHEPFVIFTTAHTEYAIKAFDSLSIDYLIKPIEKERFAQAIRKLNKITTAGKSNLDLNALQLLLNQSQQNKKTYSIAIKKRDRIIFVDYDDIMYLKSEDKYVTIIDKSGDKHLSDKALHQLESNLPEYFIRINRSCIINRSVINSIEKYFKGTIIIHLRNGESIKTGESYSKSVKEKLGI